VAEKRADGHFLATPPDGQALLRRLTTMMYAYMRVSTPQQTLENQHDAVLKFADQRALRMDT